jgi:hypothetical protein
MVERTEGKWESASNWREVPVFKEVLNLPEYEYAKDNKLMSSKMVSFLDKLFGVKPVEFFYDVEWEKITPRDIEAKKVVRPTKVYHEGYDERLPGEFHTIYHWDEVYNIVLNSCTLMWGPPLYVKLKEVPLDPKVIQDAIIDGDMFDPPDDLESIGVEIGEFVFNHDPKQDSINNENVTVYHYKDNTCLCVGQYCGGIDILIKGKYSLEDIKKWWKWSCENAEKLECEMNQPI